MFILDTNNLTLEPKPYEYEGATLLIRPYPAESATMTINQEGVLISGKQQKKIFLYCLTGWENVVDANEQPLECTTAVKETIFKHRLGGIVDFVIGKSYEFQNKKKDQEKN